MPTAKRTMIVLSLFCLSSLSSAIAQSSKVSRAEPISNSASSKDSEIDHMTQLITKLKGEIPSIKDPAAKQAAEDNLELWQHMIDRILTENKKANNVGGEHHHADNPSTPALKQSPKP